MEPTTPAPAPQPEQPATPAPTSGAPVAATNPGQGLGIASLVLALLGVSLVGLILGIIGMKKSKEAGMSNGLALAGVIISAIGLVFGVLWLIFVVIVGVAGEASSTY
jgi:hypothetical protein